MEEVELKKKYISGILACFIVFSLPLSAPAEDAFLAEENLTEESVGDAAEEEVILEDDFEDELPAAEEVNDQADSISDLDAMADGLIEDMDEKAVDNTSPADYEYCDNLTLKVVKGNNLQGDTFGPSDTYKWYDLGTEIVCEMEYDDEEEEEYLVVDTIQEPVLISGATERTYRPSLPEITHFYECVTINGEDKKGVVFQVLSPSSPGVVTLSLDASVNMTINPRTVYSESPNYMLYNLMPSVSGMYTFTSVDPYANVRYSDPIAYLYDSSGQLICCQDDGAEGYNFQFFRYLEAGKSYSLTIGYYDYYGYGDNETDYYGTYPVSVTFGAPAGHVHDEEDEVGRQEATCSTPAIVTYSCSICGQTYTETVGSATGQHVWGPWTEIAPADTDRANVAQRTCTVCHTVQQGSTVGALPITIPKAPASLKPKAAAKGKVKVTWKINKAQKSKSTWKKIKKIELQYSEDPTFNTGKKVKTLKKTSKSVTLKLGKKKTYYIRIRFTDGSRGYSKWVTKKVKTKK